MDIAIIGGGAAGFFAAIRIKENFPQATVTIFEKSNKLLAKVKVSGGGRCNVTNAASSVRELLTAYPRGEKLLKSAFKVFDNQAVMEWFEERGVQLYIQGDNRVFPASNDSQSIINCFLSESNRLGINIKMKKGVQAIMQIDKVLSLEFIGEQPNQKFDKVIITTGGASKKEGFLWLEKLNHKIETPVPSLFTFNMPNENIKTLMGLSVENVLVSIEGSKLKSDGALLITHWGMSGPAILKLSAFAARLLASYNYNFKIHINWMNVVNNEIVLKELEEIKSVHINKNISNYRPKAIPERLWLYLINKIDLPVSKKWCELGKKSMNKLMNILCHDIYEVKGKTTFKEEFVTCGGVSLDSIDMKTMQSKVCKGLYFAGEVIDIDGITGGFNFQAAWSTAYVAGKLK